MTIRSHITLIAALGLILFSGTAQAGVVSNSKWDRDFKFGSSDVLSIQIFRLKDGKPEKAIDDTFKLTGSGFATIGGVRVKIGGLNMFSALATLESAFRRHSFAIGLESKAQISKQNGREIVYVYGDVKRPGVVTIEGEATLADLIEAAGGTRKFADLERVTIFHDGITTMVDMAKVKETKVRAGAVIKISPSLTDTTGSMEKRFNELGEANQGSSDLKGE